MRLFPDYDKPGPGVYPDDPKHGPFIRFFRIYSNKFLQLCLTNLLFVICNIPSMILSFMGVLYFLPQLDPVFEPEAFQLYLTGLGITVSGSGNAAGGDAFQIYVLLAVLAVLFLAGMQITVIGPVQTGLSYIYRNFSRETPTFLWADFMSSLKKNWKQSTIATLVSLLVTGIIFANIIFYNSVYQGQNSRIFITVFCLVLVFFMCIQIYVYPLIASLDLKLRHIYKNAVLFFLGRMLPTIGIIAIDVTAFLVVPAVLLLLFSNAGFALSFLYYIFFAFSFVHYLHAFFVWQQIERYIIEPQKIELQSSEANK